MRHGRVLLALIASAGLTACEPTQLYVAHNTVVGLDAAVDTNRQAGRLIVGYDRQFITLAPKAVPHTPSSEPDPVCDPPDAECREAMAVLACNEVVIDGIFLARFKDRLATGDAAVAAAKAIEKNPKAETLFDCWRTEEDTQSEDGDQ